MILEFISDPRLTAKHKAVLQSCLEKILECRDVQLIVTKLFDKGLITPANYSRIQSARSDSHRMQYIVLYSIMRGTVSQFEFFMSVLEDKNREVVQFIRQALDAITEGYFC